MGDRKIVYCLGKERDPPYVWRREEMLHLYAAFCVCGALVCEPAECMGIVDRLLGNAARMQLIYGLFKDDRFA